MRPTSPFVSVHEGRKRFRELQQRSSKSFALAAAAPASGLFDLLCDEIMSDIFHLLVDLSIPAHSDASLCLDVRTRVLETAWNLRSLLCTCRRISTIFRTTARLLQCEMAARSATQITPRRIEERYAFTTQLWDEERSKEQLGTLRDAMTKLAVHCAGPCCLAARSELNVGRTRLHTALRQSNTFSASFSGGNTFVSYRSRNAVPPKPRGSRRNETVVPRRTEWLARLARLPRPGQSGQSGSVGGGKFVVRELERIELDIREHSSPHAMRASQCGRMVALIRTVHTTNSNPSIAHSSVVVWDCKAPSLGAAIVPPDEARGIGAINAQDAWWTLGNGEHGEHGEDGEQDPRLIILWSTAYVHPIGTVVGANSDTTCCYFLSQHSFLKPWDLMEYTGPFSGKAQMASPSSDGTRVAVLVRKPQLGNGLASFSSRATMFHDICSENLVEVTHRDGIGLGRGPAPLHPHDVMTCPSAIGLSPLGDCLVAVHRRYASVVAEVLLCTTTTTFVSVQTIDVTHWFSCGQSSASSVDSNALKLPYKVVFSPCSRFAAIVDQRPMFGMSVTNQNSVVVLDLSLRHERRGVRALPLGSVDEVSPRAIEWTPAGLWVQPRHGLVFITS